MANINQVVNLCQKTTESELIFWPKIRLSQHFLNFCSKSKKTGSKGELYSLDFFFQLVPSASGLNLSIKDENSKRAISLRNNSKLISDRKWVGKVGFVWLRSSDRQILVMQVLKDVKIIRVYRIQLACAWIRIWLKKKKALLVNCLIIKFNLRI